jgi:hypothetical protein
MHTCTHAHIRTGYVMVYFWMDELPHTCTHTHIRTGYVMVYFWMDELLSKAAREGLIDQVFSYYRMCSLTIECGLLL